ncbi:MAG: hypothetical protein K8S99_12310 [Planctomycetes bacterium]|nr:hypothetical protein [Planctomycetota bacterium]
MNRIVTLRAFVATLAAAAFSGAVLGQVALAQDAPPAAGGGAVVGKVLFSGDKPKRRTINTAADPACQGHEGRPLLSEVVIVNPNDTLRNVLVYVKVGLPADKKYEPPKGAFLVDQVGCAYHPHVFAAMAGQTVTIRNSDPTLHNVHGRPKVAKEFNVAQAVQGMEEKIVFKKPEAPFAIKCDVHPWMTSWCAIFEHPYFAVTGDEGTFSIPDLPAGDYTIEAWHEKFGVKEMKVHVTAGEKKEIEFTYEIKKAS